MPKGKNKTRSQQDSAWKDILDNYLKDFLDFCLPDISDLIDWYKSYESLDKELHALTPHHLTGRRLVDKLYKVYLKNGEERWILIHLEVQGKRESRFARRMLTYHYRLFDRYGCPLTSCAILLDKHPDWRPDYYEMATGGTVFSLRYRLVKLLDYAGQREQLEASDNPFATVILCQLEALQVEKKAPEARLAIKFSLTRRLYRKGFNRQQIQGLYRFIDYLICLPKEFEIKFKEEVYQLEEYKHMPYVSTIERMGIEEGMRRGAYGLFMCQLKKKFTTVPVVYLDKLNHASGKRLRQLGERLLDAKTVEEVFAEPEENR